MKGADVMSSEASEGGVARLIVRCLENEGVSHVFGIPGEENIHLVDALSGSSIRYVLVRHEQAASFMAEVYGRLTGKAGVCSATLGPGAINLLLGVADATTNSTPVVALSAQVGMNRTFKESHQGIDLVSMFEPATKWSALMATRDAAPEMIRKAFKLAQTERPGAVYLAVPEDVEKAAAPAGARPLVVNTPRPDEPSAEPAASGGGRSCAPPGTRSCSPATAAARAAPPRHCAASSRWSGCRWPQRFTARASSRTTIPQALGAVGFMRHDYVNFGFDQADAIIAVGYELQEFDPVRINPNCDKKIIHIHRFPAEVDLHYEIEVGLQSDIGRTLDALAIEVGRHIAPDIGEQRIRAMIAGELERGRRDDRFPVAPARIVADTRAALNREDIVLVDTGALKMWMARLYQTYEPTTCLISNGLSTMAWTLPGAIGAKIARPEVRVLVATGDGAFMMNSQEIETALRERIPFVVLIWVDGEYGLIKWKMDLELGHNIDTAFGNPDFVAYAESFGARGYRIEAADELLPTLRKALADDTVSVIACPVDYSANLQLTNALGELDESFS